MIFAESFIFFQEKKNPLMTIKIEMNFFFNVILKLENKGKDKSCKNDDERKQTNPKKIGTN